MPADGTASRNQETPLPTENLPKGGGIPPSVTSRCGGLQCCPLPLLMCALLMTPLHSEGVGVYYGVESDERNNGGFSGEKTKGEVKGALASVGLRLYQCKFGPCTTSLLFRRLPEMVFTGVAREGSSVDADDAAAGVVKGRLGFDADGIQGDAPRSVLFDVKYAEGDHPAAAKYVVFLSLGLPAAKQAFNVRAARGTEDGSDCISIMGYGYDTNLANCPVGCRANTTDLSLSSGADGHTALHCLHYADIKTLRWM